MSCCRTACSTLPPDIGAHSSRTISVADTSSSFAIATSSGARSLRTLRSRIPIAPKSIRVTVPSDREDQVARVQVGMEHAAHGDLLEDRVHDAVDDLVRDIRRQRIRREPAEGDAVARARAPACATWRDRCTRRECSAPVTVIARSRRGASRCWRPRRGSPAPRAERARTPPPARARRSRAPTRCAAPRRRRAARGCRGRSSPALGQRGRWILMTTRCAVQQRRGVHLGDGCRRQRRLIDRGEHLVQRTLELVADRRPRPRPRGSGSNPSAAWRAP